MPGIDKAHSKNNLKNLSLEKIVQSLNESMKVISHHLDVSHVILFSFKPEDEKEKLIIQELISSRQTAVENMIPFLLLIGDILETPIDEVIEMYELKTTPGVNISSKEFASA